NDMVYGDDGNDTVAGGAGADTVEGGPGNDILFSGDLSPAWGFPYYGSPATPPLLDTGSDADTVNGGAGDDVIFAGYGDNVDGGDQQDFGDKLFISFQGAPSGVTFDAHLATQTIGGGTITGIENISWVQGSNYDDYIDVGSDSANGYSDFTVVYGMAGNDMLIAGSGDDVLTGGEGDDRFELGIGNDIITDLSAGDTIVVRGGFSAQSVTQVGADVVVALSPGNQITVQNSDLASVEAA